MLEPYNKKMTKKLFLMLLLLQIIFVSSILNAAMVEPPLVPSILVLSPNGGETLFAGTNTTITWNSTDVENVRIDYSTNGGLTWNIIISSTPAGTSQYTWSIPSGISTTQGRIRILDASSAVINDASNSNFTISRLELSNPVLAEKLLISQSYNIQWVASSDISNIKLEYSTDAGFSWNTISASTSANLGTYAWTVPNAPTSSALIRIASTTNSALADTSPQFTIASIALTSPNGGEDLASGTTQTISWTSSNVSEVKLEYSSNNGISWNTITSSTPAGAGNYAWDIPTAPTAQARVRVTDVSASNVTDMSDNVFTITSIKISSPNGGEGLKIGASKNITWTTNLTGNISIELSTDDGSNWTTLTGSTSASAGTYSFTVPNSPTNQARVRLKSLVNTSVLDVSDNTFTIGDITISAPAGGEAWQAGTTQTISWTSTNGITVAAIEYTTDNGTNWSTVTSSTSATAGSYSWSIPSSLAASSVKVRVRDAQTGTSIVAVSNAFSVSLLRLTAPTGGEVFQAGANTSITWQNSSNITNLTLQYSTDAGSNWNNITTGVVASAGTYTWTVPAGISTTQGRVKIIDENNTSTTASSQNNFRIGYVTVTSPNGGEKVLAGGTAAITWSAASSLSFVRIQYTTNSGTSWNTITSAASASAGTYSWSVPSITSTTVKIRISDTFGPAIADTSDNTFTIAALRVVSPNGGEGFFTGSSQNITWVSSSVNTINIEFSNDDGASWVSIVTGVSAALGTYAWTVPSSPTSQARVRIIDADVPTFYDSSDNAFKIGNISVVSPNGGEIYQTGSSKSITWTSSLNITSFNIELSTDNGTSWSTVTSGLNTTSGGYTWSISNSPSAQALIRVSDATNTSLKDVSDAVFSIRRLNVVYPNGGELLQVDSTYNITWSSSNVSNIKIEYTTNNGTDWTTIINSTAAAPQTYAWTVPNAPTKQARIRISDADNPSANIMDTSDAVFIISSIALTSPNGGENFPVNSVQLIKWRSHSSINKIRIEYSSNNGTSWNVVTDSTTASVGQYNWTVPNAPSTQVLLKINDSSNPLIADTSDAVFSISTIRLTSPNGGEKYQAGAVKNITWLNVSSIANAKLEYSVDNGANYYTIIASTPASNETYAWTLPDSASANALVRISDVSNSSINDRSDAVFTMAKLRLTAPNGSENLQVAKTTSITWNASNITSVNLEYSTNNGGSWTSIATNLAASTGTYTWTVPDAATSLGLVRVSDASDATILDVSDGVFNIIKLTLTSPVGGEGLTIGATKNITWSSSGVANVKIEYSSNNGSSWNTIQSSYAAAGGSYAWTVPNAPSNQVRVKLTNVAVTSIADSSSSAFTIGSLALTSPTTGEQLQAGTTKQITWTSTSGISSIKLEYTTDNGTSWNTIVSSASASLGSYNWNIGGSVSTTTARVKITDVGTSSIKDSTGLFTIATLQLTSPVGGELFQNSASKNITWTSTILTNVKLEYSSDNGSNWNTIIASTPAAPQTYAWTVPGAISSSQMLVRISDPSNSSFSDQSDAVFKVGDIQITSPTTGDVWQSGTQKNITWTASSSISSVRLEYSTDDGTSWNTIVTGTSASAGTYSWTIPASLSTSTGKVRAYDASGTSSGIVGTSNSMTFTNLAVTAPNGGEKWQAGSNRNITWTNSSLITNVKIEYSTNNGTTWNDVVTSTPAAAGTYSWSVPSNLSSAQGLVRISDASNSTIKDSSNSVFSFVTLSLTSPVTGNYWQGGTTKNITWTSTNLSAVKLEYTSNNGNTWNTIINSVSASAGTYAWAIPSTPTLIATSQMRVKVTDVSESTVRDSSGLFKLGLLAVTSPNGSEQWQAGTTQSVTWSSTNITNVLVEYTTDNGSNWSTIVASTPASNASYSWAIPSNISTTSARVRIIDVSDNTIRDSSDNTFTINNLVLSSPTGGEQLQAGTSTNITWSANSSITNIKIEYSTNGGTTYPNTITNSTTASAGTYAWSIPASLTGTNIRIRISNTASSSVKAESGDFTVSILNLSSPDGGEYITAGGSKNITWSSSNVSNVKLEYTENNGTSWTTIIASTAAAAGTYSWSVPSTLNSNQGRIKISDASNSSIKDSSANTFRLGKIEVTAPNGGETYQAGTSQNITWTATSSISSVLIQYSSDNGSNWILISASTTASAGTYAWAIPSSLSSANMLIRISDAASSLAIADVSDAVFAIRSLRLTAPNGGEHLQAGSVKTITWTAGSNISQVKLEYSTDGSNWNLIANNLTASNLSYSWTVDNIASNSVRIKISDASNSSVLDTTDAVFRVANLVLTAPDGGEKYQVGKIKNISWSASSNVSTVDIFYSTNNGSSWTSVASGVTASASPYLWTVPSATTTTAKVRVMDAQSGSAIGDTSASAFTITRLQITQPTTGDSLVGGATKSVQWSSSSDISTLALYYSTDNGSTWSLISNTVTASNGAYDWTVPPNINSSNARVRIVNASDATIADTSARFAIYYPSISLTYPNGGEFIKSGSALVITFTSSKISTVKVEYSTNNGTSYSTLTSTQPADSAKYTWIIPDTLSSTQTLVRVSDANNASVNDMSDFSFKIGKVTITSPNGGEKLFAGRTKNITWSATSSVSNVKIEYSSNNGTGWSTISTSTTASAGTYAWTVPSSATTQGLIRISDAASSNAILDVSDAVFTISSIVVTAPNGGEDLQAGKSTTITYTSSSDVANVGIEYSTNNGTSWNSIITSTTASGSYNWTVPAGVSSSQALIKIYDAVASTNYDSSNAVFNIKLISVTLPNGGEILQAGAAYNITWNSGSITNLKIEYSTNNGTSWSSVVSSAPAAAGTYAWTVPAVATSQGRIRLSDASNSSILDISDTSFTIGTLALTAPNGGENIQAGKSTNITWTVSSSISNVKLEYSTNNGAAWSTIIASTTASAGSYTWSVPVGLSSTQALVRISDVLNPTLLDVSDAVFNIKNITVVTPNGGEVLQAGAPYNITWTSGSITTLKIEYSSNNGSSWTILSNSTAASSGSYAWTVPSIATSQGRIRLSDSSASTILDVSDTSFAIGTLTVTAPNGGENIQAGKSTNITWSASSSVSNVKIEYSTNNGSAWSTIVASTPASSGTYSWSVPSGISSSQTLVKISDVLNTNLVDSSDAVFNIKDLVLTYPNGGEELQVGSSKNITWTAGNISNVKLEYSTNDGSSWITIVSSTAAAAGTYAWTVANAPSNIARFRITDASASSILDLSDTTSRISNVTITSPNGGEQWQVGATKNITWTRTSNVTNVDLYYSTDNGANWTSIDQNLTASALSYAWIVPSTVSSQALVKIAESGTNLAILDSSDAVFRISNLEITVPAGGESWAGGSTQAIRWISSTDISGINIYYSTNNGTSWSSVAQGVTGSLGIYNWLVPTNINTSQSKIRIEDSSNVLLSDTSNSFSITYPTVSLSTPNGGENIQAGMSTNITWSVNSVSNVKLEYTLDNGTNWNTIISSVPSTGGTYAWIVPDTASTTTARVRISDAADPTVYDSSESVFTITKLAITSPDGGEIWQAGSNQNITWDVSSHVASLRIEYTTNNGSSWSVISTSTTASTGSYAWTIPSTLSSTTAKVRINVVGATTIADTSSASFKIGWIVVTSPNGGENIVSGKRKTITWSSSSSITNVRIDYSLAGDSSYSTIVTDTVNAGSYSWYIPQDIYSSDVRVRISDASSALNIFDKSDTSFTISNLRITAPTAGENWRAGSTQTITWNSSPNITLIKLELSTNSGMSWDTIRTNINSADSSLDWTIPTNLSSPSCRIRVTSQSLTNITDTTGLFTIFIPSITVSSPNGGEYVQAGDTTRISWINSFVTSVRVEYSTNNGTDWNTITASTSADSGYYDWVVSNSISSTQALVKLTDVTNSNLSDSSNAQFTIGWIQVLTPNGGESILAGSATNITWNASNSVSAVNIEYLQDSTWSPVGTNISAALQTYQWNVPQVAVENSSIRISASGSSLQIQDTSDNRFAISSITVLSPNGGEFLQSGVNTTISWSRSSNISNVKIELSTNNGAGWSTIIPSTPGSSGQYTWNIPVGTSADSGLIRISDASSTLVYDVSDNTFKVGALQILTPNDGGKLLVGGTQRITWDHSANVPFIDLHYTTNAGTSWIPILGAQALNADSAYFDWTVPNTPTDSAKIRIRSTLNTSFQGVTNNFFTFAKLSLTSFNGGQVIQTGTEQVITWQASKVQFVAIDYTTNNGVDWTTVTAATPGDSGKYTWTLQDDINLAGATYKLRLRDLSSTVIVDTSNAIFTVSYLKLVSPNGGGGQLIGTSYNIQWLYSAGTMQNVKLEYTTNNGSSWITITSSYPADSLQKFWLIPSTPSASCRVRVSDAANTSTVKDISDSTFTLSSIAVTYPNGGTNQKLQAEKIYNIKWTTSFISRITIEFSIDNGSTWNFIADNLDATSGQYAWDVDNFPTQQALIKISDYQNPNVYDLSDANFKIVTLKLTAPNTVVSWNIGSTQRITWQTQYIDSVRLQFSSDGGNTWPVNIISLPSDSTGYNWTVPDIRTINARIRVTEKSDVNLNDAGDTTFSVNEFPKVTQFATFQKDTARLLMNNPNTGEILSLTKLEYQLPGESPVDVTNALVGSYTNITQLVDTIYWNTAASLNLFEGKLTVFVTYKNNFNFEYRVQVDSVGIDNKAPVFVETSLIKEQNPYLLGWDEVRFFWNNATDTNSPILYSVYISDSASFASTPSGITDNDTLLITNLRTATTYNIKMVVTDKLGNSASYTTTYKTLAVADFSADNRIDAVDLAAFVQAWTKKDSIFGADMHPYTDTIPRIAVKGNSKLDVNDLFVFVNMWNYYQINRTLPKVNFAVTDESKVIKFKKGENNISIPLDLKGFDLLALSGQIRYNTATMSLDSISFGAKIASSPIALIYSDTLNGAVYLDYADLSGGIGNEFTLNARIDASFDRNTKRDSMTIFILGYDHELKQVVQRSVTFTLQEVPNTFALYQNYPNPFNPITTIEYDIPEKANVELTLYDILGRRVATLVNEVQNEGTHRYQLSASELRGGLASGIYIYRINAGSFTSTRKMVLLK